MTLKKLNITKKCSIYSRDRSKRFGKVLENEQLFSHIFYLLLIFKWPQIYHRCIFKNDKILQNLSKYDQNTTKIL